MKHLCSPITTLALLLSIFATQSVQAKPTNWKIRSIEFVPVKCAHKDCWAWHKPADGKKWALSKVVKHGNIRLAYRDGRTVQITKAAAVAGNEGDNGAGGTSDPQIAPDGLTAGWTEGFHHPCVDWSVGGTMFINPKLVLFRSGKVKRIISVPGTFISGWRFWNNGKYVAIGSRWHHGVGYVRLFDANTGKLLERMTTPQAETKKLKWAQGLTL